MEVFQPAGHSALLGTSAADFSKGKANRTKYSDNIPDVPTQLLQFRGRHLPDSSTQDVKLNDFCKKKKTYENVDFFRYFCSFVCNFDWNGWMETLRTRDVDRRISFLDGLGFSRLLLYWVGNGTSTNLTADDLRPLEPVVARGYKLFHSAGRKKKQLDRIQNVIVILSTDKSSQSVENNEEFNRFCKKKKTFPSKLSRKKRAALQRIHRSEFVIFFNDTIGRDPVIISQAFVQIPVI